MVKQLLYFRDAQALWTEEVEDDANVNLPGTRAHRQPIECRETHAALKLDAAESAHIEAPLPRWATMMRAALRLSRPIVRVHREPVLRHRLSSRPRGDRRSLRDSRALLYGRRARPRSAVRSLCKIFGNKERMDRIGARLFG